MLDIWGEVCYNGGEGRDFGALKSSNPFSPLTEEGSDSMGSIAGYIQQAQHDATRPITALTEEEMPRLDELQQELAKLIRRINVVELVTPQKLAVSMKVGETYSIADYRREWTRLAEKGTFRSPRFIYNMDMAEQVAGKRPELNRLYDELGAAHKQARSQAEKLRALLLLNRISSALGATYIASGILHGDDAAALGGSLMRYDRSASTRGMSWKDIVEWAKIGVDDLRLQRIETGKRRLDKRQADELRRITLDASGIAKWFRWAVDLYGFDYSVEVDTAATAIDVRETSATGKSRIVIPATRKVNGLKLVTLIRHEIDCHARDVTNGRELLWGLGGGALRAEDDVVYEGHAMTEEHAMLRYCTGESPRQALPWYVLAISLASNGASFDKVAQRICELRQRAGALSHEAAKGAWTTTYRVFRGGTTTRNRHRYAFWKDKAYLQGTLEIGDLYAAGLSDWAELGAFELDELVMIAGACTLTTAGLPHRDRNTAKKVLWKLLE